LKVLAARVAKLNLIRSATELCNQQHFWWWQPDVQWLLC